MMGAEATTARASPCWTIEAKPGCARSVSDMDDDLGVPNCERCLVPMVFEGTDEGPYWCCPECRIVRLA